MVEITKLNISKTFYIFELQLREPSLQDFYKSHYKRNLNFGNLQLAR